MLQCVCLTKRYYENYSTHWADWLSWFKLILYLIPLHFNAAEKHDKKKKRIITGEIHILSSTEQLGFWMLWLWWLYTITQYIDIPSRILSWKRLVMLNINFNVYYLTFKFLWPLVSHDRNTKQLSNLHNSQTLRVYYAFIVTLNLQILIKW